MIDTTPHKASSPSSASWRVFKHDPVFGPLTFCEPSARLHQKDGAFYLQHGLDLGPYERCITDILAAQAECYPDRPFMLERNGAAWVGRTYAQMWHDAQSVGQALLNRGLVAGDTVVILAKNSVAHAQFMFGAMTAGIVVAPISMSYARFAEAHERLIGTFAQTQARVIFVDDPAEVALALDQLDLRGCEIVTPKPRPQDIDFAEMLATTPDDAIKEAHAGVGADTVAKILFTSGSTGTPKGVINTHRMLCANQKMAELTAILDTNAPRILLCWLPWHHTFGGNYVVNNALATAATLYIDDGRPVLGEFTRTLTALRALRPTTYSNVPVAYTMLVDAMEKDTDLAEAFFSRLVSLRYGGAAFPASTYDRLQALAEKYRGHRIPLAGGFAMTETAPSASGVHWPHDGVDHIGLPLPGVQMKLVPLSDERFELRLKGPSVFPGYLGQPKLNEHSFDDEGYFLTGDAVTLENTDDLVPVLKHAGRISEDYKLVTGTWVQVGAVRTGFLSTAKALCRDVVIAGEGQPCLTALVWMNDDIAGRATVTPEGFLELATQDMASLGAALEAYNAAYSGSSRRIQRIAALAEPPSMGEGEINDKGYVNQRCVLRRRSALVDRLYQSESNGRFSVGDL